MKNATNRRNLYLHSCFVCTYDEVWEGKGNVLQRSFYKIGKEVSVQCEVLVSIENKIKDYAGSY